MNLTDIGTVKGLLNHYGFSFSKSLGQNFLINPSVCPRMAEACHPGITGPFAALEIGPGIGVLTKELAQTAQKVVSIELDSRLQPVLKETLSAYPNVELVWGDAMKLDLAALIHEKCEGLPVVVCANLPYYITSPLLMKLLESRLPVEAITVLVQKEAAQRLCAVPGTRESGAVTLAVAYYAEASILFPVSHGSFLPAPKVDSSVIQLHLRQENGYTVSDEKLLFRLIRSAFNQRRKTLTNSLVAAGFSKDQLMEGLTASDIRPTARAEELTMENFIILTDNLKKIAETP